MTKIFFGGLFFLFLLTSCSSRFGIQNSYAFSRKMTAGNIPVDANNRPQTKGVQTAHLIYVETKADGSQPVWDTAWVKDTPYLVEPLKIMQDRVTVGRREAGGEEIILQPKEGGALWQLMLKPVGLSQQASANGGESQAGSIRLSGTWRDKRVNYTIKEEVALATVFGE